MGVIGALAGFFAGFAREKEPQYPQFLDPSWPRPCLSRDAWLDRRNSWRYEVEHLRYHPCFGGLDLSAAHGINSLSLVFPPDFSGGDWRMILWAWIPRKRLNEDAPFAEKYREFAQDKALTAAGRECIDTIQIVNAICHAIDNFDLIDIGYEYNCDWVVNNPSLGGGRTTHVNPFGTDAGIALEHINSLLLEGRFHHGNNPLLDWCVNHATGVLDADKRLRLSAKYSVGPISPVVSTVLAVSRALAHQNAEAASAELRS